MYKPLLAGCLGLLLCACHHGGSAAAPATTRSAASASAVASSVVATDAPDELTPPRSAAELSADMLDRVLSGSARGNKAKKLDKVRHPRQTLAFFGLRPDMNVIEVDPSGTWYAAILAPLLAQNGDFTVAIASPLDEGPAAATRQSLRKMFEAHPKRYGRANIASFDPNTPNLGTPGSADLVLAFRCVHVWVAADRARAMFAAAFGVLRPGGILGVVDNRAPADARDAELKGKPYLRQRDVIRLAQAAGFQLDAESRINANPADSGVSDKAPDDADRMTLRFVKPRKPTDAGSSAHATST